MTIQQKIIAFSQLGEHLRSSLINPRASIHEVIQKAYQANAWFTTENSILAIESISKNLTEVRLTQWVALYEELKKTSSSRIGVIMAGNIPLVGFHDFLCVLITGNIFIGKLSSQDKILLPHLAEVLIHINPAFNEKIFFVERLERLDAVIATGSDNTSRYFEYYFGKYPHIIRKNRNSVALLSGTEKDSELTLLGKDIFQNFGLGCRNVSKLFVPVGYDLNNLLSALKPFSEIINHKKYGNNYDYYKAGFIINNFPFLDTEFILLKKDKSFSSPVSVLFYEYYENKQKLIEYLIEEKQRIQCMALPSSLFQSEDEFCEKLRKPSDSKVKFSIVPFGNTQNPTLDEYSDNIDTVKFLLELSDTSH